MYLLEVPIYYMYIHNIYIQNILQYSYASVRIWYMNIMIIIYNIFNARASRRRKAYYYNYITIPFVVHLYVYGKIKPYYSFNVNNPTNTCQRLLINYPAVLRRRHRTRPRCVQHPV